MERPPIPSLPCQDDASLGKQTLQTLGDCAVRSETIRQVPDRGGRATQADVNLNSFNSFSQMRNSAGDAKLRAHVPPHGPANLISRQTTPKARVDNDLRFSNSPQPNPVALISKKQTGNGWMNAGGESLTGRWLQRGGGFWENPTGKNCPHDCGMHAPGSATGTMGYADALRFHAAAMDLLDWSSPSAQQKHRSPSHESASKQGQCENGVFLGSDFGLVLWGGCSGQRPYFETL